LLYDLKSDPHELKNLINDPTYKNIVIELNDLALNKWPNIGNLKIKIIKNQKK